MKSFVPLPAVLLLALGLSSAARAQAPTRAADPFAPITKEIEQGRLAEAEKALRGILQSYPNDLHALSLLGVVLDSLHQYKEAEQAYLKAVKLAPDSASLLRGRGVT